MRLNFESYLEFRMLAIEKMSQVIQESLKDAIGKVTETIQSNGKLFICGNGGSAADAQHVAAEFINGMSHPNNLHLPALALTTDTSILTSHANDYSFDSIFEVQLKALAQPDDCVLLLTTSGKSKNILRALQYCHTKKLRTILIMGSSSTFTDGNATVIRIPSTNTQVVQELTLMVEHFICERVIANVSNQ